MTTIREHLDFLASVGLTGAHVSAVSRADWRQLPYHNAEHCFQTAERAAALASHVGVDPAPLVLAGLYHDADHRGPGLPDTNQVENAVTWWLMEGRHREWEHRTILILDRPPRRELRPEQEWPTWIDEVPRLIRATCWPHSPTDRLDELVLRDADLAQTLQPGWLELFEAETGQPADPNFAASHLHWPEFFGLPPKEHSLT